MNKEIIINGKKIFYRVYGNGKPVMLVHGFGETGNVWKNQVGPPQTPPKEGLPNTQARLLEDSLLKDKFMFIVPDLPGTGKSEMIDDMSMEGMAEVLKAIMDKENIQHWESSRVPLSGGFRGAVIGHSMGGYIVLAFAEKYPQYLTRFGLFHSSAYADSEEKKVARRKGIAFIKEHGSFEFFKNTSPDLFSPLTKSENQHLIDDFIQSLNNFSTPTLVSYYEAMMKRPDRTSVLKNATIPVLFIMGKYDTAVPLEDGLKLCHLPEISYIDILKKSGHMGMLEEPEESNKMLEKFLT